jgi:hypothetical protein
MYDKNLIDTKVEFKKEMYVITGPQEKVHYGSVTTGYNPIYSLSDLLHTDWYKLPKTIKT